MNTPSRRKASADYHAKLKAEGHKKVTLFLSPEAQVALDVLAVGDVSKAQAVNAALIAAARAVQKPVEPDVPARAPTPVTANDEDLDVIWNGLTARQRDLFRRFLLVDRFGVDKRNEPTLAVLKIAGLIWVSVTNEANMTDLGWKMRHHIQRHKLVRNPVDELIEHARETRAKPKLDTSAVSIHPDLQKERKK